VTFLVRREDEEVVKQLKGVSKAKLQVLQDEGKVFPIDETGIDGHQLPDFHEQPAAEEAETERQQAQERAAGAGLLQEGGGASVLFPAAHLLSYLDPI
jgi:hypothetical protein